MTPDQLLERPPAEAVAVHDHHEVGLGEELPEGSEGTQGAQQLGLEPPALPGLDRLLVCIDQSQDSGALTLELVLLQKGDPQLTPFLHQIRTT